jgi:hypothetical protein
MTIYWQKGDGGFLSLKDGEKVEDLIFFLSKQNEKNDYSSLELSSQDLYAVWNLKNAKEFMRWLLKKENKDPYFKEFFKHIEIRLVLIRLVKSGKAEAIKINGEFQFCATQKGVDDLYRRHPHLRNNEE